MATLITKIKNAPLMAIAGAHTFMLTATAVHADDDGSANIRGALDTNQQALTAVEDSSFTEDGVEGTAQSLTNSVLFAVGAIGVIMTAFGIYSLWKHSRDGERSRGGAGQGVAMIAIGGLMTIAAIVTAIVPNLVVGGEG